MTTNISLVPIVFCITTAFVMGCSGVSDRSASNETTPFLSPGGCAGLNESMCAMTNQCVLLYGEPIQEAEHCVETKKIVGCVDGAMCDGSVLFARNADSELYRFLEGCAPTGWTPVETGEVLNTTCTRPIEPSTTCLTHSFDECQHDERCMTVKAERINESAQCVQLSEWLCIDANDCPPQVVVARSPADDLWQFPAGCTPPGWPVEVDIEHIDRNCNEECSLRPFEACMNDDLCMLMKGNHIDESRMCIDRYDAVACSDNTQWPPFTITFARSPSGDLYQFGGGTPPGWEVAEDMPMPDLCSENP